MYFPYDDIGYFFLCMPLYYLLAKVHRVSTKQFTKSFFSVKLCQKSRIATTIDPHPKG